MEVQITINHCDHGTVSYYYTYKITIMFVDMFLVAPLYTSRRCPGKRQVVLNYDSSIPTAPG